MPCKSARSTTAEGVTHYALKFKPLFVCSPYLLLKIPCQWMSAEAGKHGYPLLAIFPKALLKLAYTRTCPPTCALFRLEHHDLKILPVSSGCLLICFYTGISPNIKHNPLCLILCCCSLLEKHWLKQKDHETISSQSFPLWLFWSVCYMFWSSGWDYFFFCVYKLLNDFSPNFSVLMYTPYNLWLQCILGL